MIAPIPTVVSAIFVKNSNSSQALTESGEYGCCFVVGGWVSVFSSYKENHMCGQRPPPVESLQNISKHYDDVIMSVVASQITSLTIVYPTVYSGADQRKHRSSASLAFVWGIHRWPVNSPHKWPVTRKMFHLMTSSCYVYNPRPLLYLCVSIAYPIPNTISMV